MSTNRLFNLFIAVALLVVAVLLVREANATATVSEMDSATRSYIAWGEALAAAGKLHNPVARSDFSYVRENKVAPASYRSPLDECFDVPLREIAQCREASR